MAKNILTSCFVGIGILIFSTGSYGAIYTVSQLSNSDCTDLDCNLQDALTAVAVNGGINNEIHLAQGTYTGNFVYHPTAGNDGNLSVLGGYSSDFLTRVIDPTKTILDGNGSGSVLFLGEMPAVTNGSFTVEGVTIKNGNTNQAGGGVAAVTLPPGSINLSRNILNNNISTNTGGGCALASYNDITNEGGNVILDSNIIKNNVATGEDNGHGGDGNGAGCMVVASSNTQIINNLIYNNVAGISNSFWGYGGGLLVELLAGDVFLVNNTITKNSVKTLETGWADGLGGGVAFFTGDRVATAWAESRVYITNNIIYENEAETGYGEDVYYQIYDVNSVPSTLTVSYNDYGTFENPLGGEVTPTFSNNIQVDPLFSTSSETLYRLRKGSQCIDSGNNQAQHIGTADLSDSTRPQDNDKDGNAVTNMGCFENIVSGFSWNLFLPSIITSKDVNNPVR